jgi:hypothetical protein
LRVEIESLQEDGFDLDVVGFSDEEIRILLAGNAGSAETEAGALGEDETLEAPVNPVSRTGDIWAIGRHRIICGDCRDSGTVAQLLDGARANVVITSPPYATQREYDPASGFKPVPRGIQRLVSRCGGSCQCGFRRGPGIACDSAHIGVRP